MIRKLLMLVSALTVMLVAGLLAGCEKQAEEPSGSSVANAASEPAEAPDEVAERADHRAMAHEMDKTNIEHHEMDMQAAKGLQGNFVHQELVVLDDPVDVPSKFTAALGQMHQHYRAIAQAFVADDAEAADAAAQKMREQVAKLDVEELDAEAKEAWVGHRKVMRTSLHQLAEAEDIESKREHFSHISEAMYCALKSFGGVAQKVHVAYCPMAMDGKGAYWLADKAEIENPYMGQKMASCGEIKEAIN